VKDLLYLKKYFYKYKKRLVVGAFFVIMSNVFKVISPKILGEALDIVRSKLDDASIQLQQVDTIKEEVFSDVLKLVLTFFAVALISGIFTFLMRQSIIVMSRFIENDLRNDIYKHYQILDQDFYKRNNTGDLMNRATTDVAKVRMFLGPAVMYTINVIMLFSFIIYSMLQINVEFTFWVLLPLPLLVVSIYKVQSLINIRSKKIQERLSDLTNQAQEYYSGIRVLKSFVQEKFATDIYIEQSENYKTESLKMARIEALFFPLMILLVGLSTVIVIFVGAIKMNEGLITAGNILEFVFYVNMLTWPISSVGWVATLIQTAAASQKRINEFLFTKPKIKNNTKKSLFFQGNIYFDDVSFTYEDTKVVAIKNVSFKIKKGERIAIMGKTGSGKTTLVELINRLYDATKGEIFIDENDIKKVNLFQLRAQIGYIPQDVFLFSDTILNNIKFSDKNISESKIMDIAKKVSVHDEILKFPKEYHTIVGERGVALSGGQKQRISIARALIKNPSLYVFDDSLSALDTKTEKDIFTNLVKIIKDKTIIVVTHRIPKDFLFDRIIVLEDGRISEMGTHEELMGNKKYYFSIYNKQMNL